VTHDDAELWFSAFRKNSREAYMVGEVLQHIIAFFVKPVVSRSESVPSLRADIASPEGFFRLFNVFPTFFVVVQKIYLASFDIPIQTRQIAGKNSVARKAFLTRILTSTLQTAASPVQ